MSHNIIDWNGEYLYNCLFFTVAHPVFTKLRAKWYSNPHEKGGHKIVPPDLHLTWRTAAVWTCDDGSNHFSKKYKQKNLILHTESFSENDVDFLLEKLYNDLGISGAINHHYSKPTIRICGDNAISFIEQIKPFIPWKCFQYKLKTI